MFPPPQERKRDFMVRIRRRGNGSRIHEFRKFIERFGSSATVLFRDRIGPRKIDIVDRGEIGARNFSIQSRMIGSNVSDADYANAKLFHWATFFKNQS